MPCVSPVAFTVKTPVVPEVEKQFPPSAGFALVPTQTPLPVIGSPPSDVTSPPKVAWLPLISVLVGEAMVGAGNV